MAGCAAADQAGDARTRWQERQHRLRRRRSRAGRRPRALRRVRQRGTGLLRPLAHLGRAHASTTASWRCSSRPSRASSVGDPTLETTEMGPLISAAHLRHRRLLRPRRRARRRARLVSRRAGQLVRPDRAGAGGPRRPRRGRGDLRAGGRRHPLRGRGRRRAPGQRHALRALGVAVDARRRAGAACRPGRRDRDAVGQLALLGALLDARSAA